MRTKHISRGSSGEPVEITTQKNKLNWHPYLAVTLCMVMMLFVMVKFSGAEFNRDEVIFTGFWLALLTVSTKIVFKLKNFKFESPKPATVEDKPVKSDESGLVFQIIGLFFRVVFTLLQMLTRRSFWHNVTFLAAIMMIAILLSASLIPPTLSGWQFMLPTLPLYLYTGLVVIDRITKGKVKSRQSRAENRLREALTADIPVVAPSSIGLQPVS